MPVKSVPFCREYCCPELLKDTNKIPAPKFVHGFHYSPWYPLQSPHHILYIIYTLYLLVFPSGKGPWEENLHSWKILQLCGLHRDVGPWEEELTWAVQRIKGKALISIVLRIAWRVFIYFVWRERNRRLHNELS